MRKTNLINGLTKRKITLLMNINALQISSATGPDRIKIDAKYTARLKHSVKNAVIPSLLRSLHEGFT
jgi:hypothetical protein